MRTRRSCCWCAIRPTSRSRSTTSGATACGPTRRPSTPIRSTARRSAIAEFVAEREAGLAKVIDFMNRWARRDAAAPAPPGGALRGPARPPGGRRWPSILAFMGTPGEPDEIAEAVAFASFENMQRMEQRRTFWLSGGRMVARDRSNPQLVQGAPRQGRRLARPFHRGRGRAHRAADRARARAGVRLPGRDRARPRRQRLSCRRAQRRRLRARRVPAMHDDRNQLPRRSGTWP